MAALYGWGSTGSRLQSYYEEAVYFLDPEIPGTHLIKLGGMKG